MSVVSLPAGAPVSRPLHVAMVAPPYFTIPPEGYGGVESVVAGLVDGLVDRGHRVTLLAAGDHATRAQRFIRTWDEHPVDQLGEALPEVVNTSVTFFVIYLYTKFFDWWWDWMPKYLFFLLLAAIALIWLYALRLARRRFTW